VRVALAGGHNLPMELTAGHLLKILISLPPDVTILLRRPKTPGAEPGRFEREAEQLATLLNLGVEWFAPEGVDRSQTYLRDLNMVRASDFVIAFFPTHEMTGGTGHVVDAALSQNIAVVSWAVDPDGTLVRIGEYDPSTDGP
jgi:hypothetical protein